VRVEGEPFSIIESTSDKPPLWFARIN